MNRILRISHTGHTKSLAPIQKKNYNKDLKKWEKMGVGLGALVYIQQAYGGYVKKVSGG